MPIARFTIGVDGRQHHPVDHHRPIRVPGELRQDALRLADRVAEQHRRLSTRLVATPPLEQLVDHHLGGIPPVNRKAEGGFGDEGLTAHGFERVAGRVGRPFVVAGHDAHTVVRAQWFEAYLRRAQHVSRGMKAHPHVADGDRLAIRDMLDDRFRSESPPEKTGAWRRAQVRGAARPRVITMRMRDQRARHRPPRIDVEATGGAEEAVGGLD